MTDDKCAREIKWAGGTSTFTLNTKWVRNVLAYRGLPDGAPAQCLMKFETGSYSPETVEEIMRLGLLGGGMPERDVEALLDTHVRGQPIGPNVMIAMNVLVALFTGDNKATTEETA